MVCAEIEIEAQRAEVQCCQAKWWSGEGEIGGHGAPLPRGSVEEVYLARTTLDTARN